MNKQERDKQRTDRIQSQFESGPEKSINALYQYFQMNPPTIPKSFIKKVISKNTTYQRTQPKTRATESTAFNIEDPGYMQIDLIDTKKFNEDNQRIKYDYVLVGLVPATRKLFAEEIINKQLESVQNALISIKGRYPGLSVIQCDNEFKFLTTPITENGKKKRVLSTWSRDTLRIKKVVYSTPHTPTSQAFVERANGDLKRALGKHYMETGKSPFRRNNLQKIVDGLNDKINRTTGVAPNVALVPENFDKILDADIGRLDEIAKKQKRDKLNVGDFVRIAMESLNLPNELRKKISEKKGFMPKWGPIVYKVDKVYNSKLPYRAMKYKIKEVNAELSRAADLGYNARIPESKLNSKRFLRGNLLKVPAESLNKPVAVSFTEAKDGGGDDQPEILKTKQTKAPPNTPEPPPIDDDDDIEPPTIAQIDKTKEKLRERAKSVEVERKKKIPLKRSISDTERLLKENEDKRKEQMEIERRREEAGVNIAELKSDVDRIYAQIKAKVDAKGGLKNPPGYKLLEALPPGYAVISDEQIIAEKSKIPKPIKTKDITEVEFRKLMREYNEAQDLIKEAQKRILERAEVQAESATPIPPSKKQPTAASVARAERKKKQREAMGEEAYKKKNAEAQAMRRASMSLSQKEKELARERERDKKRRESKK